VKKKVGYIVYRDEPQINSDDQKAEAPLKEKGISILPVVWDDPNQDLQGFDAFIFRSCWNYHRFHVEFMKWIEGLEKLQKPIFNSPNLVRWNLNKKYLLEMQNVILVARTFWWPVKTALTLSQIDSCLQQLPGDQVVIKPAISLNGQDTFLMAKGDRSEILRQIQSLLHSRDVLLQEFLPEIQTSGEVSLLFFDGQFSHAVRKKTKGSEFRIHAEYGGTREGISVSSELVQACAKVVHCLPEKTLYARVDIVETKSGPSLIELEITDPMLYLAYDSGAADKYASALKKWLDDTT
jgi:glutathione synthase/RimK-type ligase-like ATP-grasp enzyme